ncbi:hypothetical protein [Aestuariivirga sp.]|uniref:hypothetical protein n=1 Tax=Aestuariivirga sp. TaxID=2650926 RepID=UPI003BA9F0D2
MWQAVQQKLKTQASQRASATDHATGSLLAGFLFDETGDRLTPSQAIKDGRRYHCYISQRLMQARRKSSSGWRIPAHELDMAVLSSLRDTLEDQSWLYQLPSLATAGIGLMKEVQGNAKRLVRMLSAPSPDARAELINLMTRIDIVPSGMRIALSSLGLELALGIGEVDGKGEDRPSTERAVVTSGRRKLIRLKPLPPGWADHRHALGFDQL